jgi:hypothetical protein
LSKSEKLTGKIVLSLITQTLTHTDTLFDFEKLEVYKKAKQFNKSVSELLKHVLRSTGLLMTS